VRTVEAERAQLDEALARLLKEFCERQWAAEPGPAAPAPATSGRERQP
jgi:hypothetical protein